MNDYFGSINWSEVLSGNVHDDWHVFKVTVQDAIAKYIPTSIPKNNKPTPWWSKNLSKAIKAKQLCFTKYKHSKSRSDYATHAAKRNDVKCKIRSARNSYERSLLDKLCSNPKALYSYIKSKQKIISQTLKRTHTYSVYIYVCVHEYMNQTTNRCFKKNSTWKA